MPPLAMPWSARNFSSVRTSTSKIALPIASTSYFASAINPVPADKSRPAVITFPRMASRQPAAINTAMIRSFVTVSSGTLASRLLGFVRDSMVAALLGAGPVADACLLAFQRVTAAPRLLTEGAVNAALVPACLRLRDTKGAAAAAAFAGRLLGTGSAALVAATALLALVMPLVIMALAPGFAGREALQMAVDDARLMLPYLAFAGPVTVLMAIMNAQGRYALIAFSPLLFNIALISAMAVLLLWRQDAARAALILAAVVGIAGLLQLSILILR